MRQGQQNRRGRGRSNNNNNNNNQNRKGQNPLTRSFESTGPDVKLRGTPAHIAEKYIALARDAQSAGDPVLAENYLQHAEHYNRIIMTFREQQIAQGGGEVQNGAGRPRPTGYGEPVPMGDDYGDDEGEFGGDAQPQQFSQPRHEGQNRNYEGGGQRFEGGGRQFHNRDRGDRDRGGDRNDRGDRGFSDRQDRGDRDRERGDRGDRGDRGGERFQRGGDRQDRQDRPERHERPERVERVERADRAPQPDVGLEASPQPRRERPAAVPHHEQPEFLRRPVRRPRRETAAATADDEGAPAPTPAVEGSGD
jgi:hypothetical protein